MAATVVPCQGSGRKTAPAPRDTRRSEVQKKGCRAPWFGVYPGTYLPLPSRASAYFPGIMSSAAQGHICVCIPCYNEKALELHLSLKNLQAALAELSATRNVTASVCVVLDGWAKADATMKTYLKECFPDDSHAPWWGRVYACDEEGEAVTFTVQNKHGFRPGCAAPAILPRVCEGGGAASEVKKGAKVDLALVIKGDNRGKMNSHEWFFKSYVKRYACEYMLLTDCGTLLAQRAVRELYDFMEARPNYSASSGFQRAQTLRLQSGGARWFEPPLAALYRMGQMFDHEASSLWLMSAYSQLGFMNVLPGPCQFLRSSDALTKDGPVDEYLRVCKRATTEDRELVYRNLKITEDRVLSYTMVSRCVGGKKRTGLVPSADFLQDAQTGSWSFLAQRRRWNNGAVAAALVVLFTEPRLWDDSGHGFGFQISVKGMLGLELVQHGLSLLAPSVLVTIIFSADTFFALPVPRLVLWAYCGLYLALYALFVAAHHRRRYVNWLYHAFAAVNIYTIVAIAIAISTVLMDVIVRGQGSLQGKIVGYATIAVGLISVFCPVMVAACYGRFDSVLRLLCTAPAHLLLSPIMGSLFQSYSMARTWDVSWGNRPATHTGLADEELDEEENGTGIFALSASSSGRSVASDDQSEGTAAARDVEWGVAPRVSSRIVFVAEEAETETESLNSSSVPLTARSSVHRSGAGSSSGGPSPASHSGSHSGSRNGSGAANGGYSSATDLPSGAESDQTTLADYMELMTARDLRLHRQNNSQGHHHSGRAIGDYYKSSGLGNSGHRRHALGAPIASIAQKSHYYENSSSSGSGSGGGLQNGLVPPLPPPPLPAGKAAALRPPHLAQKQATVERAATKALKGGSAIQQQLQSCEERAAKTPDVAKMKRVSLLTAAFVVSVNLSICAGAFYCGYSEHSWPPILYVLSLAATYGLIGMVKLTLALMYAANWCAAGPQRRRELADARAAVRLRALSNEAATAGVAA